MVLGGDVTIKDSQIEIGLPEGSSAASPGNPVVISARTLKPTKTGGGGSVSGPSPEAATPPTGSERSSRPRPDSASRSRPARGGRSGSSRSD